MPSVYLGDFPEPDAIDSALHPRKTARLVGHERAQGIFLSAYNSRHLHHAWLITGPKGIGKATFAWACARFLRAQDDAQNALLHPATLNIAPDHPIHERLAGLNDPGVYLLRRGLNDTEKAPAQEILVKEVRKMKSFFTLSTPDNHRRIAIIDSVDELNPSAANALLKLLEEPPADVIFFLISHQPFRLLPTIRSRCQNLRLGPLSHAEMADICALHQIAVDHPDALNELAGGSAGTAMALAPLNGIALYEDFISLFAALPKRDTAHLLKLAQTGSVKGEEAQFALALTLLDVFLSRLARFGTLQQLPRPICASEPAILTRLAPHAKAGLKWAELGQTISTRTRRARAVNLDAGALLMDMLLQIEETALNCVAR